MTPATSRARMRETPEHIPARDVVFFKNISLQTFPFYIYASWYQRADKSWVFGSDNNYKTFAYSVCCSPYELPNDWFTAYGPPHPAGITDSAQWSIGDNADSLQNPDAKGHNAWWDSGVNPMAGAWAKVEIAVKVTNQTDGYVKVWGKRTPGDKLRRIDGQV